MSFDWEYILGGGGDVQSAYDRLIDDAYDMLGGYGWEDTAPEWDDGGADEVCPDGQEDAPRSRADELREALLSGDLLQQVTKDAVIPVAVPETQMMEEVLSEPQYLADDDEILPY